MNVAERYIYDRLLARCSEAEKRLLARLAVAEEQDRIGVREALARVGGDVWARPRSWRGTGEAVAIHDRVLVVVPSARGGDRWSPTAADLMGGWEVVDVDHVLAERGES